MCDKLLYRPCIPAWATPNMAHRVCRMFPFFCTDGRLPDDFKIVLYSMFTSAYSIKREDVPTIAVPLESYLNCSIEFAGNITQCDMENVLGSFYSLDDMPQFCYSIYSVWGKPNKKRTKIPKGATMKFIISMEFLLEGKPLPLYNPPREASVQLAVRSPYFLPSPYLAGSSFLGGRAYELRIKLKETHLLPLPYQTNCTDYMADWKQRSGKAPVNQLNIIQECRINKSYEAFGCVPMTLDYPHEYNICRTCPEEENSCTFHEPPNKCVLLADTYNQACDSITYSMEKKNKDIVVGNTLVENVGRGVKDTIRIVKPMHDCEGEKALLPECLTITIEVPFDQFEITNMTYKPKFESLELFSVFGGYMGMWLGISLLAIYDMFFDAILYFKSFMSRRNKSKIKRFTKGLANQREKPVIRRRNSFHNHYADW